MIPRVLFVLGKGGTGRSSVAAALGSCFAARGENTLIVEWAFAEAIAPWFGKPPAGHQARAIAPNLSVMNFSLDETLREYFVGHLRLRLLHDFVIANRHVQRLIHAAPGIAELLFCGRLFWLTELARGEIGVDYRRIVVDAPATGHGEPLFGIPRTLAGFDAAGLLALERERVTRMFADPSVTGAVVVTLAEELALEETRELLPRLRRDLGRPEAALIVNRSVSRFFAGDPSPRWLAGLGDTLSDDRPPDIGRTGCPLRAVRMMYGELLRRRQREAELAGALPLDEALLALAEPAPLSIVRHLAAQLDGYFR